MIRYACNARSAGFDPIASSRQADRAASFWNVLAMLSLLVASAPAFNVGAPSTLCYNSLARSATVRCDAISDAAALLGLGDPSDGPPPQSQSQTLIEGLIAKNKVMLFMKVRLR